MPKQTIYNEQLRPLLDQVKMICEANNIACVLAFGMTEDDFMLSCRLNEKCQPYPTGLDLTVIMLTGGSDRLDV